MRPLRCCCCNTHSAVLSICVQQRYPCVVFVWRWSGNMSSRASVTSVFKYRDTLHVLYLYLMLHACMCLCMCSVLLMRVVACLGRLLPWPRFARCRPADAACSAFNVPVPVRALTHTHGGAPTASAFPLPVSSPLSCPARSPHVIVLYQAPPNMTSQQHQPHHCQQEQKEHIVS